MKHLALGVLVGFISTVNPATLTFDTAPPGRESPWLEVPVAGAVTIEGWQFVPTLANQWVVPDKTEVDDRPWMYLSPWLGFTGNSPAEFVVSRPGSRFDFFGFDSVGLQTAPGRLVSSAGHVLDYMTYRHMATPYSVDWRDLEWIRFEHDLNEASVYGPNGIDNLQVIVGTVTEPGTAILIGIGGLLLAFLGGKRCFG